ncbi:hypothetical protein ACP70R_047055 [Stipagrostis hirtigluma subsp. patula]
MITRKENRRSSKNADTGHSVLITGAITDEIQAWIDQETITRLVFAKRRTNGGGAEAAHSGALTAAAGRKLFVGQLDTWLQRALCQHGVFVVVEAELDDPAAGDGC